MNKLFIFFLTLYRNYLSPLLPNRCRFEPSCSVYAIKSLKKFSFIVALSLIIFRLLRCHPFSRGGVDEVP